MSDNKCLYCDKKMYGRADKKFCNDYCRSAYNNQARSSVNNIVRNINSKLKRNRNILENILGKEHSKKCHKDQLVKAGYLFDYHTHVLHNKRGDMYYFCYEYGYLQTNENWYLIVKSTSKA